LGYWSGFYPVHGEKSFIWMTIFPPFTPTPGWLKIVTSLRRMSLSWRILSPKKTIMHEKGLDSCFGKT
jgi:hypothetical protein